MQLLDLWGDLTLSPVLATPKPISEHENSPKEEELAVGMVSFDDWPMFTWSFGWMRGGSRRCCGRAESVFVQLKSAWMASFKLCKNLANPFVASLPPLKFCS